MGIMINKFFTYEKPTRQIQIKKKLKKITKQMILDAQSQTKSNFEAAKLMGIGYDHYRNWAKHYGVFEQHKNQCGKGISKRKNGFAHLPVKVRRTTPLFRPTLTKEQILEAQDNEKSKQGCARYLDITQYYYQKCLDIFDLNSYHDNIPADATTAEKPVHIPGKRLIVTKKMILNAQSQTKSNMEAARCMGISYTTYKKWAKHYGVFEQHLNQEGVGVKKSFSYVINPNAKKYKYFSPDNLPKHNSVVYWLGLDKKDSIEFNKKWNCNPIKVGKSKDLLERVNEVLGKYYREMLPKTEMWEEWLEKAKPLGWLNFWTEEEAKKVERAFHYRLKPYKMNAGSTKEMFDTSVEQIEEIEKEMYSYRKKDMKNSVASLETNIPDSSNNKDLIRTIMMEWAYRVPNGMPDTKNEIHLNHLKLLLKEMNMPDKFIEGLYKNLL